MITNQINIATTPQRIYKIIFTIVLSPPSSTGTSSSIAVQHAFEGIS